MIRSSGFIPLQSDIGSTLTASPIHCERPSPQGSHSITSANTRSTFPCKTLRTRTEGPPVNSAPTRYPARAYTKPLQFCSKTEGEGQIYHLCGMEEPPSALFRHW